ncbi:MAG: hypothetical protein KAV01_12145, partial [Candidatus Lokiarchaeota archaeon]|nr:hypothetical protein [Candidatus Lokiarchaeota archaeon]
ISTLSKNCSQKIKSYVLSNSKVKDTKIKNLILNELREIQKLGINILRSVDHTIVIHEYKF